MNTLRAASQSNLQNWSSPDDIISVQFVEDITHTNMHTDTILMAIFQMNISKLVAPSDTLTGRWVAIRYYSLYPTH